MPQAQATIDVNVRTKGTRWSVAAAKFSRFMPERIERALLAWALRRLKVQTRIGTGKWTTLRTEVAWEGDTLMYRTAGGEPIEFGRKVGP